MLERTGKSFDLISPTAFAVTYFRQFSDIPYAVELAQRVNAQTFVEQYLGKDLQGCVPLLLQIEARYKAINHLITRFGYTQILELASGLLPRGMVMSENPNITFVESDLPAMVDLKKELVSKLIGNRPNLHFKAIDATRIPSQFPLHADYLRSENKVTILCEGLLSYLTFPEKERVCANIREVLSHYGGVWITPDLTTKQQYSMRQTNPAIKKAFQGIANATGRSMFDNSFNDMAYARQFFQEQGFCIEEHSMMEVIDELTCLAKFRVNRGSVEHFLATMPVFALTLNRKGTIL